MHGWVEGGREGGREAGRQGSKKMPGSVPGWVALCALGPVAVARAARVLREGDILGQHRRVVKDGAKVLAAPEAVKC